MGDFNITIAAFYYSTPCCGNRRNTGNITLYGIRCIGFSLPFVQDCQYSTVLGYSSGSCNLQQEITVGCYEQSNCTNGDLHLRGGINALEGRVEFCRQGIWGTIAAISWDAKDAMVVCRQLGHPWGCEYRKCDNISSYFHSKEIMILCRGY